MLFVTIKFIYWTCNDGGHSRYLYFPGTDHAGIATQVVVEKRLQQQGIQIKNTHRQQIITQIHKLKEEHEHILNPLAKIRFKL